MEFYFDIIFIQFSLCRRRRFLSIVIAVEIVFSENTERERKSRRRKNSEM